MKKSVKDLLIENGPMLSGELAKLYEKENNDTNMNARQAISRARSPVQKNKLVPFQNNQVFVYLENQFMNNAYLDRLYLAIARYSKSVYAIVTVMVSQNGMISKNILSAYSMSPVTNLGGHKRFDVLINKLIEARIIHEYNEEYFQLSETFSTIINCSLNFSRTKAIELSKKMVLNDFYDLTRKTNIISYNRGNIWSEFAHFNWGFVAPSYLQGIASWNLKEQSPNPGFILADVVLQRNASINDILFFVEKVNIIKSFKKISNFVPTLIIYSLDEEALRLLKQNNIAIALIDKVFGDSYVQLLEDLINIIANATVMVLNNPKRIDKIFDSLAKMDGRYNNIVGDMFELMVAELYRCLGVNYLEVNKQVPSSATISGRPKEIDVLVDRDGVIIVVECKASAAEINDAFVNEWLSVKIIDIYKFLSGIYPAKKNFEFQLWSIGGFTEDATTLLHTAREKTKKYKINYFNKNDMIEFAKDKGAQKFLSHLKKHFK